MLKQQKKLHINWKRVLFVVLLFSIFVAILYSVWLYHTIQAGKTGRFDEAVAFVLQQTDMERIDDIHYFQEAEGYFILEADDGNDDHFVFLRDDETFSINQLYIIPKKEVLSQTAIENSLMNECQSCELVHSKPAMIDKVPLWELTYYDASNRYVIEYKYLKNGQTYEKLKLTTK